MMNPFFSSIKAVLFDLDGTILDTLADLTDSVNYALSQSALPPVTLKDVRRFLGNGMTRLITLCVPEGTDEATFQRVYDTFMAHYKDHCTDKTGPYEGIPELIRSLRSAGLKTAVVSNKGDFAVQTLVASIFPGLFDFSCGEKQGVRRKPAPDTVFECLKHLDLTAKEAVYIGDSEVDIETAANAGMPIISVEWGFRDHDDLLQAGAGTLVTDPSQIADLLL